MAVRLLCVYLAKKLEVLIRFKLFEIAAVKYPDTIITQVKASMLLAALERLHGKQRESGYGEVEHQGCLSVMS